MLSLRSFEVTRSRSGSQDGRHCKCLPQEICTPNINNVFIETQEMLQLWQVYGQADTTVDKQTDLKQDDPNHSSGNI